MHILDAHFSNRGHGVSDTHPVAWKTLLVIQYVVNVLLFLENAADFMVEILAAYIAALSVQVISATQ